MKTMRKSERLGSTVADTYQGKHCLVSACLVSASSHWQRAVLDGLSLIPVSPTRSTKHYFPPPEPPSLHHRGPIPLQSLLYVPPTGF